MIFDIKTFKDREVLLIFLDLVLLISPGIVAISLFNEQFFLSTDWVKLILLSISIAILPTIINLFTITALDPKQPKNFDEGYYFFWNLTESILITSLLLYITIIVRYFLNLTIKQTFIPLTIVEILFLINLYIDYRKGKQK